MGHRRRCARRPAGARVVVEFPGFSSGWIAYPRNVVEMALANTIENRAAYRRGDLFGKMRSLMDDWATLCTA
jgi:hypothetical protein